jgi:hypothetical protein
MATPPRIELRRIRTTHAPRVTRRLEGSRSSARAVFHARGGKAVGGKPPQPGV